jgi:hypothetical protein
MNLVKLILVSFLSLTLLHQCGGGKSNTNSGAASSTPTLSPTDTDLAVRTWYQSFVHTSLKVHELPFRLPDSAEHEVFEASYVRFVATDNPLGGHPDNDVGDAARKTLRQFMNGMDSDDLFYNGLGEFSEETGHDLLGEVALVEARKQREGAARAWVVNKFYLRKSVSESVRQRWNTTPPPTGLTIPQTLADYVQREFESLKNQLPAEQQARLAGWRTSVGPPPNASVGESLWLKQTSNVLWISPFLIRGLLLESVQQPAEDEYDAVVANGSSTTNFLNNPDVRSAVATNFNKSIRYLLAHSMGHVTLVSSPGVDKEVAIDQMAFSLLSSKNVGPYLQFLDEAVRVNEASSLAWGVEASNDGRSVSTRIKSLQ